VKLKIPSLTGRFSRGPPIAALLALAAAMVLATGPPARATSLGQLDLRYAGTDFYLNGHVHLDGSTTYMVVTGKYILQVDPDPTTYWGQGEKVVEQASTDHLIDTFCGDIEQSALGAFTTYDVYHPEHAPIGAGNSPMGIEKAWDLRRLFDQHWGDVASDSGAAAFQASTWEIIYEDTDTYTYDVTAGDFWMEKMAWDPDWLTTANTWLAGLGTDKPDVGLRVLANEDYQDYALVVTDLPADPIPEPLTLTGMLLGVGCLGGYLRRRR
jgi:hypothetical protein